MVSAILRNTILQRAVTDDYRGRISSIQQLVVTGGPRLGDLESGAVASLTSVEFSIVSGGVACILGRVRADPVAPELLAHRHAQPGVTTRGRRRTPRDRGELTARGVDRAAARVAAPSR